MRFVPRLDRIVRIDRGRAITLAVACLAALAFHGCAVLVGDQQRFHLVLILLACVLVVSRTDGVTEALLMAALVLDWWAVGGAALTYWSIPAATCLLVVHCALALAASGPDAAPIPRVIVHRWVKQTVLVAAAAAALGAVVIAVGRSNIEGTWIWMPVALMALASTTVVLTWQLTRSSESESA